MAITYTINDDSLVGADRPASVRDVLGVAHSEHAPSVVVDGKRITRRDYDQQLPPNANLLVNLVDLQKG